MLHDDDLAFLHDMLAYARTVGRLVDGKTLESLRSDETLRLALERAIEVVGEAARGVSKETTAAHPEIPWRAIIAQRHIISHEYGMLDHRKLWTVATVHVPPLIAMLERVLGMEPPTDI